MIDVTQPKTVTKAAPGVLDELRRIVADLQSGALDWRELPAFILWAVTTTPEERRGE